MALVYLNGEFLPLAQAKVSVLDRGFLFGDGVYEVIPVYGGHFFRLSLHLQRLEHSLQAIHLENPLSPSQWREVLQRLVARNEGLDQAVYLQVTRGPAARDHAFPQPVEPTVFAMSNPLKPLPTEWRLKGVAAVTREDIRWKYCHIKSVALLANILLRQEAIEAGAQEALLLRDEQLTEGAASNVFIVRGGVLATPPKGPFLLSGITRDLILELAGEGGIPCRERVITAWDLTQADELWLTSSTREIVPVTRLDGIEVGSGKPGPLWGQMDILYQEYKARVRAGLYEN
ncbi:aminotransferase class IV [Nitrosococcus halophilus Nc 4]|uniref:Aminodeoxychorismate lyase n=1 Tax=Nitrosococcus halophilus (strain Nc4) TaxID=472759 RepID=D5BWB0_NITHN|nr:D-amino acid aminotransferase [Nitrosococcus halophilus]ADE13760.1 aminotransferase class IV [Nitrosococcus halophilus Nc 4]